MRKIALLAVVALAAACGGSSSSSSTPTPGSIRLAHLSAGGPAVDFCYATQGTTTFSGPVLKGAGSTEGLPFTSVSKYFDLAPGAYTVRVVAFAAGSCAAGVPGIEDVSVTVAEGTKYTVAAAGYIGQEPPLNAQLRVYTDESTPNDSLIIIRFVNAVPGTPAVDIGTGAPTAFTAIFRNLAYLGLATATPPVDTLGYASVSPTSFVSPLTLTTCISGPPPSAQTCPASVTLPTNISNTIKGGTVASAFAVPLANNPAAGQLVLCGDSEGAVPDSVLSACIVQGQ